MFLSFIPKLKSIIGDGEKQASSLPSPLSDDPPRSVTDKAGMMTNQSDDCNDLKGLVYDYIRGIKDPEKPATLEDLHVVYEEGVEVGTLVSGHGKVIRIEFNPTVPHCTLATLIGLCIRVRLERTIGYNEHYKLDIYIKKGTHNTEDEINKQINDKERIAAAMENPNLRKIVEECIQEEQ